MTKTAYSIETLQQAFPAVPPSPRTKDKGGRATGSEKVIPFQSRILQDLIDYPVGQDRSADSLRFAGEAARTGWSREDIKAMLLNPDKAISAHCLDQADPDRAADRTIDEAFKDLPKTEPVVFVPSPYVWVPAEDIPPIDWLLGRWLLREEVTFVVAPGGVGKTTFLTAAALSLVTGKDLLGKTVPGRPKRVWLWNLEDSSAMMTRSIQATAKLYNIEPGELGDRLFLDTARDGSPLCTTRRTREGLEVREPVREALVAALQEKAIDVLIIDPFVSSHDGNENDNGEMDRVVKAWCRIAQEAGCAVILCHHTSKAGSTEVNTMSARGAVAMTAAARVVLTLNPMSRAEANKLGIVDEERWRLVQVTMDKSNRAPLEKADWYRKVSVLLGAGDSAGAVQPWSPPKAADLLTPDRIDAIKEALSDGKGRSSLQSPGWAGYTIATVLGLTSPERDTPERGLVSRIIAELKDRGHLVERTGKDASSKRVPFLHIAQPDPPPAQSGVESGGES